jgi:hypothetical protein
MHQRTDLASGQVTNTDRILIELIQPPDSPPLVSVAWPLKASVSSVEAFPAVASKAAALFAQAATRLAQHKAKRL